MHNYTSVLSDTGILLVMNCSDLHLKPSQNPPGQLQLELSRGQGVPKSGQASILKGEGGKRGGLGLGLYGSLIRKP